MDEEQSEDELLNAEQLEELDVLNQGRDTDYPKPASKESQYKFFRYILGMKDSSKVGNLNGAELGIPKLPVRAWQSTALYAEQEGLGDVGKYLRAEGEIILATSGSKKGFMPQLFVTQIKKDQKIKAVEPKKNFLFGGKNKGESQ